MNEWKCWGFWRFILSISTLAWMLYSNWIKVNNACVNTTQIGNTCKKKTTNIRFDQYINLANNSWRIKDQLDVLAILFHLLCAQHILDINIYIVRSLPLFCWITTFNTCNTHTTPNQQHRNFNTHRTKNNTTNVVIQQNSSNLLMMDILMSETCWAHKKRNKIASDIKLVFYSSTITMTHGPINISSALCLCKRRGLWFLLRERKW